MDLNQLIGQKKIQEKLFAGVNNDKTSHAHLLHGKSSSGILALAMSFVKYLLCENRTVNNPCNNCLSCRTAGQFKHPDFHVVYPVVQAISKVSKNLIDEWRELTSEGLYFNLSKWIERMDIKGRNPIISVEESKDILQRLTLKSFNGGYKIVLIWMAEKMNNECSNKLLKLIEEPPSKTIFILACEDKEFLLPTILSRTQQLFVPEVSADDIIDFLMNHMNFSREKALETTSVIGSNLCLLNSGEPMQENSEQHFDLFSKLMRICYKKDVNGMLDWSSDLARQTKDFQKQFIDYSLQMFRQSIRANYLGIETINLRLKENEFLEKFAPYICEKNIREFIELFDNTHYHIDRNANAEIMFTHLCFKSMRNLHKM